MPSQAELRKRRVNAGKQKIRQEVVIDRRERRRRLVVGGFVALLALALIAPLVGGIFLAGDDGPPQVESITLDTTTDPSPTDPDDAAAAADLTDASACPAEDGSSPRTITFAQPHPMCIDTTKSHVAVFDTSEGEIRVTLTTAETPITVNNFVNPRPVGVLRRHHDLPERSVDRHHSGRRRRAPNRHRTGSGLHDPRRAAVRGDQRRHRRPVSAIVPGQLVMARTALPNSSSAQYFFTTGENAARLDGQGVYVVFGETDEDGLGVLQSIIGLHEPGGALGGAPSRTVTVNSVTIEVT